MIDNPDFGETPNRPAGTPAGDSPPSTMSENGLMFAESRHTGFHPMDRSTCA